MQLVFPYVTLLPVRPMRASQLSILVLIRLIGRIIVLESERKRVYNLFRIFKSMGVTHLR
jgi:hypothetical protein